MRKLQLILKSFVIIIALWIFTLVHVCAQTLTDPAKAKSTHSNTPVNQLVSSRVTAKAGITGWKERILNGDGTINWTEYEKVATNAGELNERDYLLGPKYAYYHLGSPVSGNVKVSLIDQIGKYIAEQSLPVKLQFFLHTDIPVSLILSSQTGGYMLVAEYTPVNGESVISRRFLKIGQAENYSYFNINPKIK